MAIEATFCSWYNGDTNGTLEELESDLDIFMGCTTNNVGLYIGIQR